MAIIKCPECKSDVSDMAKFCPHCGYPVRDRDLIRKEPSNETDKRKEYHIKHSDDIESINNIDKINSTKINNEVRNGNGNEVLNSVKSDETKSDEIKHSVKTVNNKINYKRLIRRYWYSPVLRDIVVIILAMLAVFILTMFLGSIGK